MAKNLAAVKEEFEQIEKSNDWPATYERIKVASKASSHRCETACQAENKRLNRYRDVIPYDQTRVQLQRLEAGGYINANLVRVACSGRAYILTQGPLDITIGHFWLMVWEQNTRAIVMLNRLIEKSVVKCDMYWPNLEQEPLLFPDLKLSVKFQKETSYPHYVRRELELQDTESRESRTVLHFHYTSWPDFGVPSSPSSLLSFLEAVRGSGALSDCAQHPPVVHCSAGIGRSGTFCLVDSYWRLLQSCEDKLPSVREVLLEMRDQRMGLIQTAEQLRFSYVAILASAVQNGEPQLENGGAGDQNLPPTKEVSTPQAAAPPTTPPPDEGSNKWVVLHLVAGLLSMYLVSEMVAYLKR